MSKVPVHILANTEFEKISIAVDLAEEREDVVKYRIRLILDSTEYIIYRDYKNFKTFHSNIRFQFPKLELPSFPSKYALYNIKESRRKSFDKILKSIVSMGCKLPSLSKKEFKRHLIDFVADNKQISTITTQKDQFVEEEQIKSSSGTIMSFMDVKLDEEDWITYYASLINNDIYLFPDDSKGSYFSLMICCLGTEMIFNEADGIIEIHHPHEKKPILMRTGMWKEWKDSLVVASSQTGNSQDYKRKSVGRVVIKIYSGQNIKTVKPATSAVRPHVFVKIALDKLNYQTSIMPQEFLINWNQTFIL